MRFSTSTTPRLNEDDFEHCSTALQIVKRLCALLNIDPYYNHVYQSLYKVRYWHAEQAVYITDCDYRILMRVLSAPINERNLFKVMYLEESIGPYARQYAKRSGVWDSLAHLKGVSL